MLKHLVEHSQFFCLRQARQEMLNAEMGWFFFSQCLMFRMVVALQRIPDDSQI